VRSGLLPLLLAILPRAAQAQAQHLSPQVRVHGGASLVEGPAPFGVNVGMDSRLTRLLVADVGGFATPAPVSAWTPPADPEAGDWMRLRHGLYVMPGIVVPHRQPSTFRVDVVLRAGASVLFLVDLNPATHVASTSTWAHPALAAGAAGLDLLVQKGAPGVRLSYRQFFFSPFSFEEQRSFSDTAGQVTLEGCWQFDGKR